MLASKLTIIDHENLKDDLTSPIQWYLALNQVTCTSKHIVLSNYVYCMHDRLLTHFLF